MNKRKKKKNWHTYITKIVTINYSKGDTLIFQYKEGRISVDVLCQLYECLNKKIGCNVVMIPDNITVSHIQKSD